MPIFQPFFKSDKHKNFSLQLEGFSIAWTFVLILSMWIGTQEHKKNLVNTVLDQ